MWVYTYLYIRVRDTNKRRREEEGSFFPTGENIFPDRAKIFARKGRLTEKGNGRLQKEEKFISSPFLFIF